MECCLYKFRYNDWDCKRSRHLEARYHREHMAVGMFCLYRPRLVNVFVVNKGHAHGIELHALFDNGVIKIINPISRKVISYLFPRVKQYKKYYESCGMKAPQKLLEMGKRNYRKGWYEL